MTTRIAVGDATKKLKLFPKESINCVMTSPPYWKLRDYQAGAGEIGKEPTLQGYIDNLMGVIGEIYRILMPHGTFWLNLGDCYVGNEATSINRSELPRKSLCLLPYRIAIAMLDRGWIIRNVIVWWKPDCMPENVEDRFTVDYEPVFLCTKNPQYYFKQQLQPYSDKTLKRCKSVVENGETFDPLRHKSDPNRPSQAPMRVLKRMAESIVNNLRVPGHTVQDVFNPAGANRRCVWRIPTACYRGAHFAVFPEKLVEICIDAGCPPGGSVLDPFLGAGTTAVIAERMGMNFYGIELNPDNAQHARERILAART